MSIFRIFSSRWAAPSSLPLREIKPRPTEMEMLIREISSSHKFTRLLALSRFTRQIEDSITPIKNIEDVVHVLVQMFSEESIDQDVCDRAIKLLGTIRKDTKETIPGMLPIIIEAIENKDKFSPNVRGEALIALSCFGKEAKDKIPLMISSLADEDGYVSLSAGAALSEIAKEAKQEVKESLLNNLNNSNDQIRSGVIGHLGIIFKKEAKCALETLSNGLSDGNDHIRRSSALALGYIGQEAKSAIPDLVKLLADKPNIAETANWALTEIAKELRNAPIA